MKTCWVQWHLTIKTNKKVNKVDGWTLSDDGKTLTKKYIIEQMMGNEKYGDYVPDKISPNLLSRDFLFSVRYYLLYCIANSIF